MKNFEKGERGGGNKKVQVERKGNTTPTNTTHQYQPPTPRAGGWRGGAEGGERSHASRHLHRREKVEVSGINMAG